MRIATFRGINVYVHWTFWLLIAVYLLPLLFRDGVGAALSAGAFIMGVFACVVAHEFGHAIAAEYFGIPTADITLLPIGGVARLKDMPEKPSQELVIALAGPAVNVVIAAVLFVLILVGVAVGGAAPGLGETSQMDLLAQLLVANLFLFGFNLLPAFPMDGGRVLRALIALRTTHLKATEIAARVGRWMALFFVIAAFTTGHLMLLLIAGFIFLAGTAELMNVRMKNMAGMPSQRDPQGDDQQSTSYGPIHARWQTRVWPSDGGYEWPSSSDSRSTAGDVIDAIDVQEVSNHPESNR